MAERNKLVIYFGSNTLFANLGVNIKCKIKCGGFYRYCFHFTFRSEYKYFLRKKVQFKIIKEVKGIFVSAVQHMADAFEPFVKLSFFVLRIVRTCFVFPVRS